APRGARPPRARATAPAPPRPRLLLLPQPDEQTLVGMEVDAAPVQVGGGAPPQRAQGAERGGGGDRAARLGGQRDRLGRATCCRGQSRGKAVGGKRSPLRTGQALQRMGSVAGGARTHRLLREARSRGRSPRSASPPC